MNAAVLTLALLTPAAPPAKPAPAPDVSGNVGKGLKWLAGQQKKDGSWEGTNGAAPTSVTAMAGLAFLMEGSTPKGGAYAPNIRKAVEWFEAHAAESGKIGGKDPNEAYQYLQVHANAVLFLACVYDVDDDAVRSKRLRRVLEKGVDFLATCQTAGGGWGYISAKENNGYDDSLSTVLALQALFAARRAGIDVPRKLTDRGTDYLVKATNKDGGVIFTVFGGAVPMGNDGQPYNTAGAAAALFMSDGPRPGTLPLWVRSAHNGNPQLLSYVAGGGTYALLQQLQVARVYFALGEHGHRDLDSKAAKGDFARWSDYRAGFFKTLAGMQGKDGAWPDQTFGPTYATATSLVILQLDNEYLAAFSR